jgi:hypothetical protein
MQQAAAQQPPPEADPFAAQLAEAAARTSTANAESQSALSDYTSASNAPAEQIDPLSAGLGMSLARLGQTIAGPHAPDYSGQQQALMEKHNTAFAATRAQNLTRLRATYEAAAKRAADAGDHEAEIKARAAIHKLDTQTQKDRDAEKQKFDQEQQKRLFGQQDSLEKQREQAAKDLEAQRAKDKAKSDAGDFQAVMDNNTRTTTFKDGSSVDYIDGTNLHGKDLTAVQQEAAKTGKPILSGKQVDSVHEVENAANTITNYMAAIKSHLGTNILDPKRLTTPISAALGADVGAVSSYQEALIQIIPSLISRGIRITQGEIATLQKNTPSLSNPLSLAEKKAGIYEDTLDGILRRQVSIGPGRKKTMAAAPASSAEMGGTLTQATPKFGNTVTLYKDGKPVKTISRADFDRSGGQEAATQHGYTVQ